MSLDLPASLGITAFAATIAGCLLLMSWLHHRNVTALVLWGLAFLMAAIAIVLIAARGSIPDIWSIAVANAILAAGYGAMWSGAREFEGRSVHVVGALAGAVIWLAACTIGSFYAAPTVRASLGVAIAMVYTLLTAGELWRARKDALVSRWPIIILLLVHAASLPARIPLVESLVGARPVQTNLLLFVMFESILLCMCGAYLFGSIAKDRIAQWYKQASLVDPLTGVANRRAFRKQGARALRRNALARRTSALLLFDLDRFKSVNDGFGHSAGDAVLIAFCHVATEQLRPTDLFARMGGEEFACLLHDVSQLEAISIADRVRDAFETTVHEFGAEPFAVTVSVGVAVAANPGCDMNALLAMADRALYHAKQQGRNRVELADPTRVLTPMPVSRIA